jgi:cellulose synthase/poly-beta-1,6-N-acetylglucosamine synthase-like glycosyltransferase
MIQYSVIVPAYQAVQTLPRCLAALQHQSIDRADYEIIVVDDGSEDQTPAVAEQVLDGYHTRVIRTAHGGPGQARNIGTGAADGAIILFTDADCEPLSDWIEQMARPFDDPQVAGVMGAYRTRQTQLAARFAQIEFEHRYARMRQFKSIDLIATYAAAYRKSVLQAVGGFDRRFTAANNEDVELAYRVSAAGYQLVFNPQARVFHSHAPTVRRYLKTKFKRAYWRTLVYRRHVGKAVQDSYTPQTLKAQIALAGLIVLLAIGALFQPSLGIGCLASVAVFVASTLPFVRFAWPRDRAIGAIAIPMVFARSIVFSCGIILGLLPQFR